MRCATMTDKSGGEYVFCSGGKGAKKKGAKGGAKKPRPKPPPKPKAKPKAPAKAKPKGPMTDDMLMDMYGGHSTQAIVDVLRPLVGESKAGKSKAQMGPWTKISKLKKLQKAGGLGKLKKNPRKK